MSKPVYKYFTLSVVLALAGCGDDGNTSDSGSGGSTGGGASGTTTNSSNPTASGTTTDGSAGSMSESGSSSSNTDPTTPTTTDPTDPTATTTMTTMTSQTTDPTATTTDSTGPIGETEAMTSTTSMTSESDGTSTTDGISSSTSTTGPDDTTGGDTTGGDPICQPGDTGGDGMIEKSYIWIPSQDSGQISKVNTQTLVEEARYRTGPNGGGESPSRTAVSHDGRFVVVNNRSTGRSTMIASNLEDCVDKNGNGVIDTSKTAVDIKAWGQDECVVWSITFPFGGAWQHGPRGVTWEPGKWNFDTCSYDDPKVWLGYFSNAGQNTVHFVRIDGDSGVVELTLAVPNWNGSGFAPYGGALDNKFRPWFSSLRGEIARVNVEDNPVTVTRFTAPGWVQSYGMTVDQDGNPWFGGWTGPVTVFDVEANQWVQIAGTANPATAHRGIGASDKYVWVASHSPCQLTQIDRKTRTLIKKHVPPGCSVAIGISIDLEGFLWLVDQSGFAWKIDQENVQWDKKVIVPGSHYAYSDMTGGQVRNVLPQ